jgi:hypothetical protein
MRWAGVAAAVIAGTVDVLYLGMVGSQGASNPEFLRVPFVAAFIALMAICAGLSSRASAERWRPLLLGASAAGLLLIGYFALFSIGLPLLVAGALCLVSLLGALGRGPRKAAVAGLAAGGAVAAVVVLLAGFALAEYAIRCPARGVETGGGSGFLGGSYEYSCNNGTLTISR